MSTLSEPKPARGRAQHRRTQGVPLMCTVLGLWYHCHPGVPDDPIRDLGHRNYQPRHSTEPPQRTRLLLCGH